MPNHLRLFNLLPLCVPTSWRNHCRGLAGSISITGRKDRFDRCAMELKPDSRIRSRRDPGRCICLCQGLWPDNPGIWCSDFTEVALLHRFHVEAIYNGGGRSTRSAEEEPNRGLSFVTVSELAPPRFAGGCLTIHLLSEMRGILFDIITRFLRREGLQTQPFGSKA